MTSKIVPTCVLLGALLQGQSIYTVVGGGVSHRWDIDGKAATSATLGGVYGLLVDKSTGRLLFHDGSVVSRIEPDGTLLAVYGAGQALPTSVTDGSPASYAGSYALRGMAQDATGNLYLADAGRGRVYRVALDGTVTTFAGGGTGPTTDGVQATTAQVSSPRGLVFDSKGNLDIADTSCSCIRRVAVDGTISTVPVSLTGRAFAFFQPEGLAIDPQDNLYVTEWLGHQVFKVAPNGLATIIAGTGVAGFSGDGGPASAAQLDGPSGITLAPDGSLYIGDSGNNRVRRVAPDGTISTIAGSGPAATNVQRFAACPALGDGGLAVNAGLCIPAQVMFDATGNLLIADFGNALVRKIDSRGVITTIAGGGPPRTNGDDGPAVRASINGVGGIAVDAAGNVDVADFEGYRIRRITPDGIIQTIAGTGVPGYSGDEGPAAQAQLATVGPLSFDAQGNLYVITGDSRVRRISPDGIIHLVAGTGTGSGLNRSGGDGGPAINATLNEPGAVAFDGKGNVYIADTSNARVRKIDAQGIITTILGPGQQGTDYYNSVAFDPQGNLYVAITREVYYPPSLTGQVSRVNPDGSLTPVVGNGQPCGYSPNYSTSLDGTSALKATLCSVPSMSIDRNGVMYLGYGSQLMKIGSDGIIRAIAGAIPPSGVTLYPGLNDGGPASQAILSGPGTPTFDAAGDMFIPDASGRVFEVTPTLYRLSLSPAQLGSISAQRLTFRVATSATMPEPFPYLVRASVTSPSGSSWLSVNRSSGIIGEPIGVTLDPTGLKPGYYQGVVSLVTGAASSGPTAQVDLPVNLYVANAP